MTEKKYRYVLRLDDGTVEFFSASSDQEAESYVESSFDEIDGSMVLYKLTEIASWSR